MQHILYDYSFELFRKHYLQIPLILENNCTCANEESGIMTVTMSVAAPVSEFDDNGKTASRSENNGEDNTAR